LNDLSTGLITVTSRKHYIYCFKFIQTKIGTLFFID